PLWPGSESGARLVVELLRVGRRDGLLGLPAVFRFTRLYGAGYGSLPPVTATVGRAALGAGRTVGQEPVRPRDAGPRPGRANAGRQIPWRRRKLFLQAIRRRALSDDRQGLAERTLAALANDCLDAQRHQV